MSAALVVTGIGALTPAGDAATTAAAVRARLPVFAPHEGFLAEPPAGEGEPEVATCAAIPELAGQEGPERLLAAAARACADAIGQAGLTRRSLPRCGLILTGIENGDGSQAASLIDALVRRTGLDGIATRQVAGSGHAGFHVAVGEAATALQGGGVAAVLVVAVDSHLLPTHFAAHDRSWRIKSRRGVDGFVPGEGAAAVVIETAEAATARGARPLARLVAWAGGQESNLISGERASSGAGLCAAISGALAAAPAAPFLVISDLNGESYRHAEWGLARTRLAQRFADQVGIWHPADSLGDLGAASGGVHLAIACRSWLRGYGPAPRALLLGASDSGPRAALLIESPT